TDQAAEQIERFSRYLRETDIDDLLYEAQHIARRQPALFLGGAFVLGVLGARFLKSTSPSAGMSDGGDWSGRRTGMTRYVPPTPGFTGSLPRTSRQRTASGAGSGSTGTRGTSSGTHTPPTTEQGTPSTTPRPTSPSPTSSSPGQHGDSHATH